MKNKKQTIIEWYLMEQEALKEKIFFNKMTTNEFLNEKKRIDSQATEMFYDQIYEAFESGRESGYDEAIKEVVNGDIFFGLRDGEDFIKENYG